MRVQAAMDPCVPHRMRAQGAGSRAHVFRMCTNLRSGRELATLRPEQNILEVELGILLDAQCVRPERQARHAQHAAGDRVPQREPTQKAGHYSENSGSVRALFWQHADPANRRKQRTAYAAKV